MAPPDKPQFTCRCCSTVMCTDCLSIAAELEYLHQTRVIELVAAHDKLQKLQGEIEALKRERDEWKWFGSLGHVNVTLAWMETEVWKKAHQPPKTELDKKLKQLEKLTKQWVQEKKIK